MEEQFFMGMKSDTYHLLKQLFIVILIWMVICTILIKSLLGYCENYIQKKDAKIIYEIKPITAQLEEPFNMKSVL